jgi:prophage regulatory protein
MFRIGKMAARLLSYPELKEEKGIRWSDQHLGRLERAGRFPKRVRIGPKTVGWLEDEIDAHTDALVAERDAKV